MTATIFEFEGKNYVKQRPDFRKVGKAYTPKQTRNHEKNIREQYEAANFPMHMGLVAVNVDFTKTGFTLRIADIKSGAKRNLQGDVDNYFKAIGDALNGVAWNDDKQIASLWVTDLAFPKGPTNGMTWTNFDDEGWT